MVSRRRKVFTLRNDSRHSIDYHINYSQISNINRPSCLFFLIGHVHSIDFVKTPLTQNDRKRINSIIFWTFGTGAIVAPSRFTFFVLFFLIRRIFICYDKL